jgi:hypothetical protein
LSLIIYAPEIHAESNATVSILPNFVKAMPGDNVTVTVIVSNVRDLSSWQVVLEYNASVANCTALWIPDDNVFSGKNFFSVPPYVNEATLDGLNYVLEGVTSLSGSVDISNGTLMEVNFTMMDPGQTSLLVTTIDNPAQFGHQSSEILYTTIVDSNLNEMVFTPGSGAITNGAFSAAPRALFDVAPTVVNNVTNLVLEGQKPVGGTAFYRGFSGIPVYFNASASYDPDGSITLYVWDFGDGSIVNASDPVVSHVYVQTGLFTASLTAWDNGTPPSPSKQVSQQIVIGLVLQYYDWTPFIYAVLILVVAAIAILAVWRVRTSRKESQMV